MDDFQKTPPLMTRHDVFISSPQKLPRASQGRAVSGTKRTFSDRALSLPHSNVVEYQQDTNLISSHFADEDSPLKKRQRGDDWPLSASVPTQNRSALQSRVNTSTSPSFSRTSFKSSRFVEGSMKDRRSVQPPSEYTEYGEYGENHDGKTVAKLTTSEHSRHHPDNSVALSNMTDKSEASKHSTIFKFGKSLAASFKPTNWKLRLKTPSVTDSSNQKITLQQQKHEAEKKYQEFKSKGLFQAHTIPSQCYQNSPASKHDFGDIADQKASFKIRDETLQEKECQDLVSFPTPYLERSLDDGTVSDEAPSSIGSCFNLKKPTTPFLQRKSRLYSWSDQDLIQPRSIRRLPSRKDLQKQQKLVKKVSDLETKLELARRELSNVLGEPLPSQLPRAGRKQFIPSTLASLPSERLLSGFADIQVKDTSNIGQALSTGKSSLDYTHGQVRSQKILPALPPSSGKEKAIESNENFLKVNTSGRDEDGIISTATEPEDQIIQSVELEELELEPKTFSATVEVEASATSLDGHLRRQASKKRKTFDGQADNSGRYRPSSVSDDDKEWDESVKSSPLKKKRGRPRKVQKIGSGNAKAAKPDRSLKSVLKTPQALDRQASVGFASTTPRNSQSNNDNIQMSPPPPSSEFIGVKVPGMNDLSNASPAFPIGAVTATVQIPGDSFTTGLADGEIPPVPKIPENLRAKRDAKFMTTEVYMKEEADKELTRSGRVQKGQQRHEITKTGQDFEWDDDVF